ncbi:hypothetical protein V3F56_03010 [Moorellaceae bacterium AZ2]
MFTPPQGDPMGAMLSALVLMALFFPLSKAIRNIMMGFLQWIGVDEEGVAGRAVGTLMAVAGFARLAGTGWNANVKTASPPGGGKIPPLEGAPAALAGGTAEGSGISGKAPLAVGSGGARGSDGTLVSPLEHDVVEADRRGGIKYARTAAIFSPADHFAPGSSHLFGAVWGNVEAARRLGGNIFRSLGEIRQQYPGEGGQQLTLGEALKLYTRSQSTAGAIIKTGIAVTGTTLGFGPPAVRRVQRTAEIYNALRQRWGPGMQG